MNTITVFLLIAVSTGGYNQGNVTKLETFSNVEDCRAVLQQIKAIDTRFKGGNFNLSCVEASGVILKD